MRADAPQPLIFNAWWPLAARTALAMGGVPAGAWPPTPEFLRFVLNPDGRGAHWCRPATEAVPAAPVAGDACAALVADALERATAQLAERFGPDLAAWRWDMAHRARFEHPLLRFLPFLGDWTRIEIGTGGDGETVNRGGMAGGGFAHVHGPGLRAVFDLSAPEGAAAVIGTGQSGNPLALLGGPDAGLGRTCAGWGLVAAPGARTGAERRRSAPGTGLRSASGTSPLLLRRRWPGRLCW
ncbi:penicillin acylase family protein [Pseudoroseomonas wenyumeiae]